jgi:membrane protease YdiL (CAAX protease family)
VTPAASPNTATAVAAVTLVGWNGVFLGTAATGVLAPIAAFAGGLALVALGLRRADWSRWFRVSVGRVAGGVGLGIALAGLSWWAWLLAVQLPLDLEPAVAGLYATLRMPPGPVIGLPLVVLTIVAEEIIFRGLLQESLRARLGPARAIGAVAALYAVANLGSGTWVLPVMALLLGAFWGWLAERTRGLVVPLLCHLVWDIILFVLLPLIPA